MTDVVSILTFVFTPSPDSTLYRTNAVLYMSLLRPPNHQPKGPGVSKDTPMYPLPPRPVQQSGLVQSRTPRAVVRFASQIALQKNSFWPSVKELQNKWSWIVVGAGAAAVVLEQSLRTMSRS